MPSVHMDDSTRSFERVCGLSGEHPLRTDWTMHVTKHSAIVLFHPHRADSGPQPTAKAIDGVCEALHRALTTLAQREG